MDTTPCVFIDANVLIQAGKPPGGPLLNRVRDLAKAGLIRLITTDLTILEVAKRHTKNDNDLISSYGRPHVRRALEQATGMKLPELGKDELRAALWDKYYMETEARVSGLGCETLSVNDVKPIEIFRQYTHGKGLFGPAGKKNLFPDAFIFERVKKLIDDHTHLIIVAKDGDYIGPSGDETHIQLVSSVPDLFAALGLQQAAPEIT